MALTSNVKVLLLTYRKMKWILPAYIRLHRKYWGAPVTLVAETDYSGGEFEFWLPEDYVEKNMIEAHAYVAVLRWALEKTKDKYVILMMGDYMIREPVDSEIIDKMVEYMDQEGNIMRCEIGNSRGIIQSGTLTDHYKGVAIYEHNFLPTALTPGLWDRKKFLEILPDGSTAWDVELKGRDKFPSLGFRSIGPLPEPMIYINAIRGRDHHSMVYTPELWAEIGDLIPSDIRR